MYAVAYQGKVAAVDRTNGKVVWNRDISSYTGLSAEDGRLYVSHTLGSVYALDYATSKTFWRQPALLNRRITAPLPMASLIAVGDLEGYVHFLNREDGSFASRIKIDGDAVMSLIAGASPSQVIAATRGGGLYAVSVAEPSASAAQVKRSEPTKAEPVQSDVAPESTKGTEQAPAQEERSIMFQKNDSILLPQSDNNAAPGITIPAPGSSQEP